MAHSEMTVIWAIWSVSCVGLALLICRALSRVRWSHLTELLASEDGAAYTLGYVMTVPWYVLFMCLVLESSLLIVAKFGADYAAFAAARSAIVHYADQVTAPAEASAKQAAIQAMVPFANGVAEDVVPSLYEPEWKKYWKACSEFTKEAPLESYLRAKFQYANQHVETVLMVVPPTKKTKPATPWLCDMTVDVTYRYAFHIPYLGFLLGKPDSQGIYYYPVAASATLQSEAPKNAEESLGIADGL